MSKELDKIRRKISGIDSEIVRLIARRQSCMPKVAVIKKKGGLPILQLGRERELIAAKKALAKELGVNPRLIQSIFELIFNDSRRIQRKIRK